jgi:O-acetylserine/cysteine efflux transporter
MKPRDVLRALLVMVVWALNFPISKLGFIDFPPLLFMALRFALVAALLCPFFRPQRAKLRQIMLVSVTLGTFHFSLMFSGLARTDSATAALLVQSQVPFAALLAALVFKDRVTRRSLIGMTIALLGIALIVGEPRFGSDPVPVAMILAAAFAWSVANIQFKQIGPIDGFALSGWMAFFASPQLLVLSLLLERHQLAAIANAGWHGWGAVAWGAIVISILSYGLWYPLMRKYPVNQVIPYTLLIPAFTVAASYLILGDRLDVQSMLGGATTIAGVAIIVLRRTAVPRAPGPPSPAKG